MHKNVLKENRLFSTKRHQTSSQTFLYTQKSQKATFFILDVFMRTKIAKKHKT